MLVCPGLDHARRGFETFARECFEALRNREGLQIDLVKGTGARDRSELVVPTLTRETLVARLIARACSVEPFVVEHCVFAMTLIPLIAVRRPDAVYFSEWHVGRILAAWRWVSRQSFALVFCNGAFASGGFGHLDHVQQLAPGAIEYTVGRGESPERQELLPLGLSIKSDFSPVTDDERSALRRRLNLPADRRLVLSVAALNMYHKRLEYLIEEIAAMPEPRPYLLLLGQEETETPAIRELSSRQLGEEGYDMRTVPPTAVADFYRASDVFVLTSLRESFGRVLVEAQSHGLPCLAHAYPVMSWVLADEGDTADLTQRGSVTDWLSALTAADFSDDACVRRHRSAYERFSWDMLTGRYVEMLRAAAMKRRST
jgi:glycosyltransferase involved in cell wall biosynthesis